MPMDFKLNFDLIKSFSPIILAMEQPQLLVISPALPVKTLQELIALAKSKPGQLNFGTSGTGSSAYLETRLLMKQTGITLVNVPYKGDGPIVTALLGNEIQLSFESVSVVLSQVKAGSLRALAISSSIRSPAAPDIPTVAEAAGLSDFDVSTWYGFMAPAGTPNDIIRKLHDGFETVIKSADVQKTLSDRGYITINSNPDEFARKVSHDIETWAALVKTLDGK